MSEYRIVKRAYYNEYRVEANSHFIVQKYSTNRFGFGLRWRTERHRDVCDEEGSNCSFNTQFKTIHLAKEYIESKNPKQKWVSGVVEERTAG